MLISSGKTGEAEEDGGGAIGARRREERGDKGHPQSEGKAPISLVALTAGRRQGEEEEKQCNRMAQNNVDCAERTSLTTIGRVCALV